MAQNTRKKGRQKTVHLRLATLNDAPQIRDIYAHYIDTSTTFEETLPSPEAFAARVKGVLERYPYIVIEQGEDVLGYAYAHEQAERAAYRWNVELSIYLAPKRGRKGLGTMLYQTLLELLKLQGIRRAYARVTLPNAASKKLHAKLGFKQEWIQKKAGWKCGKWTDVAWFCKQLQPQSESGEDAPASPLPFPQVSDDSVEAVLAKANQRLAAASKKPVVSRTTRKCMQGNRSTNTKPEQEVRAMLRELGLPGYRLQWKQCPGKPDIAYPGRKIAIYVNGCFWHRCPVCNLPSPQSNSDFWEAKFARNAARDKANTEAAEAAGWKVITLWEHDLTKEKRAETSRYLYEVITLES